jgi:hypothetical protein
MENEYNILEEKLIEGNISEIEKLKILERQKELLLSFLVDANKNMFDLLKSRGETIVSECYPIADSNI